MKLSSTDPILDHITVEKIIKYFNLSGWKQIDYPDDALLVFSGSADINNEPITLVLPSKETYKDYKIRLTDILNTLNDIEDRPLNVITDEIIHPETDKLSIRIISDITEDGTLPIDYAPQMYTGILNLICSSVLNEDNPRPFYKNLNIKPAKKTREFHIGQTKKGSYEVSIETLIKSDKYLTGFSAVTKEMPFNRRVLMRIQNGLGAIQNFTSSNREVSSEKHLIDEHYKFGLNGNMCKAVLDILPRNRESNEIITSSSFLYKVNWSRCWPAPEKVAPTVKIEHESIKFISKLCEAYNPSDDDYFNVIVSGLITALSDKETSGKTLQFATIHTADIEKKWKKISFEVPTEYRNAVIRAYKERTLVHITSDIEVEPYKCKMKNIKKMDFAE